MESKIVNIEIRACRGLDEVFTKKGDIEEDAKAWVGGIRPDFTVVSLTTSDGIVGTSFGFGALDSNAAAATMSQVKPFFMGRNAHDSAKNIKDFEKFDRLWNHVPIYSYSPFDNACWDIVGKMAGAPVYKILGAARDKVPLYVSSMFLPGPEDYAKQALGVKAKGYRGYKIHPPGEVNLDIECYRAVREAVGDDFTLMADPVIMDSYESALRAGRELEALGYRWFEEPLNDQNLNGLRKLREKLDIPICGTEIIEGAQYSSAHCIAEGIVDIVRADVSWRGGITSVMRTAHVAEAFGVKCELHTTIYHALEQVNLHPSLAISNCEYFETLYPFDDFIFGTKTQLNIVDGYVLAPEGDGLCIEYDWNFIEDHTIKIY